MNLSNGRRLAPNVRGLASCRRGSVSVEFVLASVPLLLMVFGFIATNAVFTTWSSMQSNAQYAARLVSTGQVKSMSSGVISAANTTSTTTCGGTMTSAQVEYYACAGLPSWTTYSVTTTENCAVPSARSVCRRMPPRRRLLMSLPFSQAEPLSLRLFS